MLLLMFPFRFSKCSRHGEIIRRDTQGNRMAAEMELDWQDPTFLKELKVQFTISDLYY